MAKKAQDKQDDTPVRWVNPLFKPLATRVMGHYAKLPDGRIMTVQGNAVRATSSGGKRWSAPRPMVLGRDGHTPLKGKGAPSGNGRILCTRDGVIVVVWMQHRDLRWDEKKKDVLPSSSGGTWAIRSTDGGRTWTDRRRVISTICGHPTVSFIETGNGNLVATCQPMLTDPGRNATCTIVSTDQGKTWRRSNIIDLGGRGHHDGAFEATLIERRDGSLWMLLRTNWDRYWEALSYDDGLSWKTIRPSRIRASSSPAYLERLASGRLVMMWNDVAPMGEKTFPRAEPNTDLSEAAASWHRGELLLAFSENDGRTWSKPLVVAREPGAWLAYAYVFEPEPGLLWIWSKQGGLRLQASEKDLLGRGG